MSRVHARSVDLWMVVRDLRAISALARGHAGPCGDVASAHDARLDHTGVHPAQPQTPADAGVDKAHGLGAEPFDEFRTAQMRRLADLQHGLADREEAARRKTVNAQIEID